MKIKSKVLSLKYRPVVFEDLIGQDVVRETISNAIKENKFRMLIYSLVLEELVKLQQQE